MQQLKLKRVIKQQEIPNINNCIRLLHIVLNNQRFTMFQDKNDRTYFINQVNKKIYELVNEVE
jgi:hypothetical protein